MHSEHVVKKFYKNPVYESAKFSHIYGEIHSVLGTISISFLIDGFPFEHSFHVFEKLHEPVILGRDFLVKEGLQLDFQTNIISRPNSFSMPIRIALLAPDFSKTDFAKTTSSHVIPPHSEYILSLKTNKFMDGDIVLCEAPQTLVKEDIVGGKCLSRVVVGRVTYRLMNPTALPIFLKPHSRISVLTEPSDSDITQITSSDSNLPETFQTIYSLDPDNNTLTHDDYITIAQDLGINLNDSNLTTTQKRNLMIVIGKNRKTFAKDFSELGLTNLFSHRIETGNSKPIKKAPYRQNPEMRRETERQVKEMLKNGFITESDSLWNSPVVLVKKKIVGWLLEFNATLKAKVISWRSVTHMCFLAFSHQY